MRWRRGFGRQDCEQSEQFGSLQIVTDPLQRGVGNPVVCAGLIEIEDLVTIGGAIGPFEHGFKKLILGSEMMDDAREAQIQLTGNVSKRAPAVTMSGKHSCGRIQYLLRPLCGFSVWATNTRAPEFSHSWNLSEPIAPEALARGFSTRLSVGMKLTPSPARRHFRFTKQNCSKRTNFNVGFNARLLRGEPPHVNKEVGMNTNGLITRRSLLAVTGAVTAVAMLSGCTTSGGNADANGITTVTLMVGAQDFTKEMIADFEAQNPKIKVNLVVSDPTRLNTMLASGNAPDIAAGAAVGSANINARGLATDLTPFLSKSDVLKESDLAAVNDSFRWDGSKSGRGPIYGIVKDWSQDAALWYNTALFDAAGLPYLSESTPITYDELLQTAKKLTVTEGGTTITHGLGMEWAWTLYGPMSTMILQQNGKLFNDDLTEIDFTSKEAQRAFKWFVDFGQAGVGPTSLNPLPDGSDYSTFAAGRMAITQDGYWYGGNFAQPNALQTVKMAPAPVMGDKRANPTYSGQGWWIPEGAKNKDAAWKLMEYYMSGPVAEKRAKSGWGLPGLKSLMPLLPQELPYQKTAFTVATNELEHSVALPDSPYISVDLLNTTIDKYLKQAINNETSVEEACAALTKDLNAALKQGKDQIG